VPVSVVIPAFNEEEGVGLVIDQVRNALGPTGEVIVVDDGSTDRTGLVAELRGAVVVRHERNRGKGAALRTGFEVAGGRFLLALDADGTYPAEMLPVFARELESHDLVVGVRQQGREHISPLNRLGNVMFRQATSAAALRRMSDPLSGIYGLRRTAVEQMRLRSEGFGIEAEIMIKAGRLGLRVREIPIEYRSRVGTSKLHPWRDGWVILRTIVSHAISPIVAP
jgi:glycosyltransferase involved in cell wall biosynthesis